jgi:hypothetical protein
LKQIWAILFGSTRDASRRSSLCFQYILFLCSGLDRTGPRSPYLSNSVARRATSFSKNQARHQSGSANPTSAMGENILSRMDTIVDFWPGGSPFHRESLVRDIHVADRQVDPAHTELLNPLTEK